MNFLLIAELSGTNTYKVSQIGQTVKKYTLTLISGKVIILGNLKETEIKA